MFLRPRRSLVPSFSAVLRLEVEEKVEEKTIVLIHSAAPSPVVVPDKESPHVPKQTRESRVAVAHVVTLYVVVRSWVIDKHKENLKTLSITVE